MSTGMRNHRARTSRAIAVGVPAALAGSIALVFGATPAHAVGPSIEDRVLRTLPGSARTGGLVLTVTVPAAAVPPATYTVAAGDTVSAIAGRFGLRTTDLLALNGLGWASVIHPGQVLRLVGTAGSAASAAPAASPPAPVAASVSYTVKAGDTISSIAHRHGVTTTAVLSANKLSWSSIIYPGQTITIPGRSGSAAAPAPVAAVTTTGSYIVKAGDTISAIAARHGVTTVAVLGANKLGWSSVIYPGQTIAIPQKTLTIAGLSAEQVANAQIIVRVGRELGVPDRGIAIALGTAMQESGIRNLDWGDRDSLGLFQQRPSHGWGTAAQLLDPVRAAKAFFGGAANPNPGITRGLLDIPGWQNLTFAQAAQAVQISAYPDAYAQWEKPAHTWLAALG